MTAVATTAGTGRGMRADVSVRALITGMGVAAPNGLGPTAWWAATLEGRAGIAPLTRFDPSGYRSTLAGEVPDFEAGEHLQSRLLPQTDHMTRLALVATDWALRGAGVDPSGVPDDEMAVVTAATAGGYEFGQRELGKLWAEGPDFVSAYQSFAWFYAVNTGQISIRHGMRGPGAVVVSEQAGGLDALGHARRRLRSGARLALTGAIDSSLCPWAWVAHQVAGGVSTRTDPSRAYLPFDVDAAGYVPGEGGALFVLETAESVAARPGTPVLGELAGYASTFDGRAPGRPSGLGRAARLALADAAITPEQVDVVFADASGVPGADRVEADVLREVFGPRGVPVTAPKTMTGRLFAGGGPLDVAAALHAIRDAVIPPTVHVTDPDPAYGLDLVLGEPRTVPVRNALVLARGRGGFNAAVVVRAPD